MYYTFFFHIDDVVCQNNDQFQVWELNSWQFIDIVEIKYFLNLNEYETGTAMNARESENYLAISRSSSASKSVEIFWAEIYRGRHCYRSLRNPKS